MTDGLYHDHQRRLAQEGFEDRSVLKDALGKMAYPIALLVPLTSIDQAISIWTEKSADGVSVVLWSIFLFTSIFWVFYGAVHKEKAIMLAHIIMILVSSTIIIEIALFS